MLLESPSENWKDYELIDSGNFEKLERFGRFILQRPEPKALWPKALSDQEWIKRRNTLFTQGAGFNRQGKEDSGNWKSDRSMQDRWVIGYNGLKLRLGLTSFKHVGVFPEQAPNWDFIYTQVERIKKINDKTALSTGKPSQAPKVLNLFAYTGAASLAAKKAGADVTHLDSVKQVVTWAKENMERSGLDNIRWIVEDALKFVKREAKRGHKYQGIILDPPAYGRGPDGERWKLDESLYELLEACSKILAPKDSFMVLNLYSNGYSAMLADTLTKVAMGDKGERISGELILKDNFGRSLPLSVFTRLIL
ncbi:MAG: class I SAM-dependent methyltransferase [Bacteroidales bacterium]